jgi:hypothetical protein
MQFRELCIDVGARPQMERTRFVWTKSLPWLLSPLDALMVQHDVGCRAHRRNAQRRAEQFVVGPGRRPDDTQLAYNHGVAFEKMHAEFLGAGASSLKFIGQAEAVIFMIARNRRDFGVWKRATQSFDRAHQPLSGVARHDDEGRALHWPRNPVGAGKIDVKIRHYLHSHHAAPLCSALAIFSARRDSTSLKACASQLVAMRASALPAPGIFRRM